MSKSWVCKIYSLVDPILQAPTEPNDQKTTHASVLKTQIGPLGKTHHIHLPVSFFNLWDAECVDQLSNRAQTCSNCLAVQNLFLGNKQILMLQQSSAHYFLDQTILVQTQLPMYRATAPYFSSVIRCFSTDTRPAPWPYSEFT